MDNIEPLRTRIAPSPTGDPHVGTSRNALYNYFLSRKTGGQFVMRLEDTDQAREVPGSYEKSVLEAGLINSSFPPTSITSGVAKPLRKSPSLFGCPFSSKSFHLIIRSRFQMVLPLRLSKAITYCKSTPSKVRMSKSLYRMGDEPGPR